MTRTIIYVDGFNLYYGALKRTPDKWLDLAAYFGLILPDADLRAVRYFTAPVSGQEGVDQQVYLNALAMNPLVDIRLGKYKPKTIRCGVGTCSHRGPREFTRSEEKQTDVGIAVGMLDDAYQSHADRMVSVSGDSDLVPALRLVGVRAPAIKLSVYIPDRRAWNVRQASGSKPSVRTFAEDIRSAVGNKNVRLLPIIELGRSQLAPSMLSSDGSTITKPSDW